MKVSESHGMLNRRNFLRLTGLATASYALQVGSHAANTIRPTESERTATQWRHIGVERTNHSYTITIDGNGSDHQKDYRFEGVQPGDIILRPFFINGSLSERLKFRAISNVVENSDKKGLGHAMMFVGVDENGQGIIMQGAPNAANGNGIESNLLDNQLGFLRGDFVRIIRMSNDPAVRDNALRFMRFHLWLADHGCNVWSEMPPVTPPIALEESVTFEGETYATYHRFTCVGAIISAYNLQNRWADLQAEDTARLGSLNYRIVKALMWSSLSHLFNIVRTEVPSGATLQALSADEILPRVISR